MNKAAKIKVTQQRHECRVLREKINQITSSHKNLGTETKETSYTTARVCAGICQRAHAQTAGDTFFKCAFYNLRSTKTRPQVHSEKEVTSSLATRPGNRDTGKVNKLPRLKWLKLRKPMKHKLQDRVFSAGPHL